MIPSARNLLKIEQIGEVGLSLQRYKNMTEIPSGPEPQVVASNSRTHQWQWTMMMGETKIALD